jgi:hypothetical protein
MMVVVGSWKVLLGGRSADLLRVEAGLVLREMREGVEVVGGCCGGAKT